jgi:putative Holliday junction resolvase
VRALGIDVGQRRIGLAVSDATGTLARPLKTLLVAPERSVDQVVQEIVVGMPIRLDGTPSEATGRVLSFLDALRRRTAIPILAEDERLSSREAEQRLALRERDWRKRKGRLDAAAAAVFLQDFLDRRQRSEEAR